jgi:hypothetical protein
LDAQAAEHGHELGHNPPNNFVSTAWRALLRFLIVSAFFPPSLEATKKTTTAHRFGSGRDAAATFVERGRATNAVFVDRTDAPIREKNHRLFSIYRGVRVISTGPDGFSLSFTWYAPKSEKSSPPIINSKRNGSIVLLPCARK